METIIKTGDKIDMMEVTTIAMANANKTPKHYASRLLEEPDNDWLKMAMPIEAGRVIPLPVGGKYLLTFLTQKGLYQCKVEITKRYKENNIYILEARAYTALERNQRREYFRLDCVIDVKYRILNEEEAVLREKMESGNYASEAERFECEDKFIKIKDKFTHKGIITDISGGGMRIRTEAALEADKEWLMHFALPMEDGTEIMDVPAEVVISEPASNRKDRYDNRIRFIRIKEDVREKIIKYVFLQERINLRQHGG